MSMLLLTPQVIEEGLLCPLGKTRAELCDTQLPGLYVEVRATSPGHGTYYVRYKDRNQKTCHQKIGRTADISLASTLTAGFFLQGSTGADLLTFGVPYTIL